MNTTANADAMTAILRQISLDWNRTISYGRSYIAIFFAYVPGFTCLMAATGSTLDSVAGAAIGGAASGFLMLNITLFSYEQMNNHHWMNGIVPINRNHQILGRFAFLIACDLVAGLEVAVSIACAGTIMHEPVKVTDAIDFAAMTVLTLVLLNAIVQPFLYRFSPYRAMAAIILSIGVIGGAVIGLCKALPEFEKTVEQLAEAISRHQAIVLAAFLIIDVLALRSPARYRCIFTAARTSEPSQPVDSYGTDLGSSESTESPKCIYLRTTPVPTIRQARRGSRT